MRFPFKRFRRVFRKTKGKKAAKTYKLERINAAETRIQRTAAKMPKDLEQRRSIISEAAKRALKRIGITEPETIEVVADLCEKGFFQPLRDSWDLKRFRASLMSEILYKSGSREKAMKFLELYAIELEGILEGGKGG